MKNTQENTQELIKQIGSLLKSFREQRGISVWKASNLGHTHINNIKAVESGTTNYTISSFIQYLRAVGISLQLIFKDKDDDRSPYSLQPSAEHPNHWVCTDTENKIVCIFEDKKFNSTQKITPLEEIKEAERGAAVLAAAANRMAEWLIKNHSDKLYQ